MKIGTEIKHLTVPKPCDIYCTVQINCTTPKWNLDIFPFQTPPNILITTIIPKCRVTNKPDKHGVT